MGITFTSDARPPSNTQLLPNRFLRPAFGELYGFDADADSGVTIDGALTTELSEPLTAENGDILLFEPFSNTYSVDFDGTNDYLTMSPVTPTAQQGTISAWVKTTDTVAFSVFCSGSSAASNILNGTFRTDMRIRNGKLSYSYQENHVGSGLSEVNGSSTINDGNWHHVAVTSNGSAWSLYVDGSPETLTVRTGSNSGNWVGDLYAVSPSLLDFSDIGVLRRDSSIGVSSYFTGSIDEVAVWDSALSSSDIASIYNSGVPNDISSLSPAGWWRMGDNDGGTGTTITDQGSGGNDGTLVNGPTFSTNVPS